MWRALPAVLALLCLTQAGPAEASAPRGWRDGVASARAYAEARAGTVSFAVRTERGVAGRSPDQAFPSASVVKAMMLAAYLRQPSVRAGRAGMTSFVEAPLDCWGCARITARDQTRFFLAIDRLLPRRHRA